MSAKKNLFGYRFSQFLALLLGVKVFMLMLLTSALYVSAFFLFGQEDNLDVAAFDLRVHAIILITVMSIAAGSIINQFYDRDRDQIIRPFRTRIQTFLEQKYYLYVYLILNALTLGIAALLSWHVFLYLLVYQFAMWLYSHKLNRLALVKNLSFVGLSLYPFFGLLVYYRHFSVRIFLMAVFLFLILLAIDLIKDTLTRNADRVFGYRTLANTLGVEKTLYIVAGVHALMAVVALLLAEQNWNTHPMMAGYFISGAFLQTVCMYFLLSFRRTSRFVVMNILRLWIFVGIVAMLLDGLT